MNSELDRTHDEYSNQSNEEFENWLDEIEQVERQMAEYLMAQREYERLSDDF